MRCDPEDALSAGAPSAGTSSGLDESPATDQGSTRDKVLQEISEHGPLSAADLGLRLGLTSAAVRRHLDGLSQHRYISEAAPTTHRTRGRGRPARSYVLSGLGHTHLRGSYNELAVSALDFLDRRGGPGAVRAFAAERAADLAVIAAPAVTAAGDDLDAKVAALAEVLTRQGYAASTRPVGDGTSQVGMQLCQGHCPVQDAAGQYAQFCETETEMFSDLLGVHVQRLASLANGEHVCTTFIPTGPSTSTSSADRAVAGTTTTTRSTSERNQR